MYFEIYEDEQNELEMFSTSELDSGFDLFMKQKQVEAMEAKKQEKKAVAMKRSTETKKDEPMFFMTFDKEADRLKYLCASKEEKEKIKQKQMEEQGFIEEVVTTVKDVATTAAFGLRRRMDILKGMLEKSYSLVEYNNKVSESALELCFNKVKEISAGNISRIVLAADNAVFNRSNFPDTS